MKRLKRAEIFEQILFSCEEMCYSVALAVSGNKEEALDLEREIMNWLWHLLDSDAGKMEIKRKIIKVLYKRFPKDNLKDYEQFKKQNNTRKKEVLHLVRNTEWKIENV